MTNISDDLTNLIINFSPPAVTSTRVTEKDILSSSLQKSLRRAHLPSALAAATCLISVDPKYFWRRLVTIAFEDFGLSDLELTAQIVEAARTPSWRIRANGDHHVASFFIQRLTFTPTDRRVDDLYMLGVAAAKYDEYLVAIKGMTPNLAGVALRAMELSKTCERDVPRRGFRTVIARLCDQAILGVPKISDELARLCIDGRKSTQCLLPVLLPSLYQEAVTSHPVSELKSQELLGDTCISGISLAAIDGYTLAGRGILAAILRKNKELSSLLAYAKGISAAKAAAALLFCVDGGLLRNYLSDPQNETLHCVAQACWSGLPLRLVPEALMQMRQLLPTINARRSQFLDCYAFKSIHPKEE